MTRKLILATALVASLATLTACGSDEDSESKVPALQYGVDHACGESGVQSITSDDRAGYGHTNGYMLLCKDGTVHYVND